VSFQHNILYGKLCFYFWRQKGKINCVFAYTVTPTVWPEKIGFPTSEIMKVTTACLKYWGKYKQRTLVIIRMIRLPWHIQTFKRILIRSAIYSNKATAQ
jgi:hypothetical protein